MFLFNNIGGIKNIKSLYAAKHQFACLQGNGCIIIELVALQPVVLVIIGKRAVFYVEFRDAIKSAEPKIAKFIVEYIQYRVATQAIVCSIPGNNCAAFTIEQQQTATFGANPK